MSDAQRETDARRFPAEWIILPVGIVLLAFVVWWPASPAPSGPLSGTGYAAAPSLPPGPALVAAGQQEHEKSRIRHMVQMLRWIPSGFSFAAAVDLGAARRFPWTRLLSSVFDNPVFRRHLDVLQLDADGFEWLALGADVSTSPVSWNGRTLQFAFVPHVLYLRGREGRMQVLRRFWQAGRSQEGLQVGQYQLVFPLKKEPHLVIGAWKADPRAPLDMVEGNRSLQDFCTLHDCEKHLSEINPWAHFAGVHAPLLPLRLGAGTAVRGIWVAGEWNMDGLLLQSRILVSGRCENALPRVRAILARQWAALRMDMGIFQRMHAVCAGDAALQVSLLLTAAEIQKQWIIFGFLPKP